MNHPTGILSAYRVFLILLGVPLVISAASPLRAQQVARKTAAKKPEVSLEVFQLKHAPATEVAKIVSQMCADKRDTAIKVVAEDRQNMLLVSAPKQVLAEIRELLVTLDKETVDHQQVKVFELFHIKADSSLLNVLTMIADGEARVSADADRGIVVAAGTASSLAVLEALLRRLDEAPAKEPAQSGRKVGDLQVRLVWLVSGSGKDSKGSPSAALEDPPSDLDNVVRELEKIGVTDLKMAAQFLVNATVDMPFTTSGSAQLNERCQVDIAGTITGSSRSSLFQQSQVQYYARARQKSRAAGLTRVGGANLADGHPRVQLDIAATSASQDGRSKTRICELQTTIRAPIGQSVVLGVASIESKPSVFVVQVREVPSDQGAAK